MEASGESGAAAHEAEDVDMNPNPSNEERTMIVESVIEPRRLAILPPSFGAAQKSQKESDDERVILDTLPYIEPFFDERMKSIAQNEVEIELSSLPEKDYLADWPLPETVIIGTEEFDLEVERIQTNPTEFDEERYSLKGPRQNQISSLSAWNRSLDMCKSNLSYQSDRSLNLEIDKRYSAAKWQKHVSELKATKNYYEQTLSLRQKEMTAINRARKKAQMDAGEQLHRLQNQWWDTVRKNNQIELECTKLQMSIDRLSAPKAFK